MRLLQVSPGPNKQILTVLNKGINEGQETAQERAHSVADCRVQGPRWPGIWLRFSRPSHGGCISQAEERIPGCLTVRFGEVPDNPCRPAREHAEAILQEIQSADGLPMSSAKALSCAGSRRATGC